MPTDQREGCRIVKAVHGLKAPPRDPDFLPGFEAFLQNAYSSEGLIELYGRFSTGEGATDALMRKAIWRASVVGLVMLAVGVLTTAYPF